MKAKRPLGARASGTEDAGASEELSFLRGSTDVIAGEQRAAEDRKVARTRASGHSPGTVMKDSRLGPRQSDATHWRCRRLDEEGGRKGTSLFWGEGDGVEVSEWPIKTCTAETIIERWGPGRYVVDYMHIDASGRRRPRGTSRVLHVTARTPKTAQPPVQMQAPTGIPTLVAPIASHDQLYSQMFSMLAYLEDRTDKARAVAAAEAKTAQERYRADLEFQLERERLASKERIAQIEAQTRLTPIRGSHFDPETLAQRIGEIVGDKVQEALETDDDAATALTAPAVPPDNTAAIVNALKDTLAPILSLVVAKLASGSALGDTALPPIGGGNGGKDPKGEPNQ